MWAAIPTDSSLFLTSTIAHKSILPLCQAFAEPVSRKSGSNGARITHSYVYLFDEATPR